jgi:hypothetical protein
VSIKVRLEWGGARDSALYLVEKGTHRRVAKMELHSTAKRDALSIMSAMNCLDVYTREIDKLKRRIEVLEAQLSDKPVPALPAETLAAVSVYQASQRLGCTTDSVLHKLAIGTLTGYRIRGKWRVYESCLPASVG